MICVFTLNQIHTHTHKHTYIFTFHIVTIIRGFMKTLIMILF